MASFSPSRRESRRDGIGVAVHWIPGLLAENDAGFWMMHYGYVYVLASGT